LHISLFSFFFSSRRRHTRFKCDWSSDVCSSDLNQNILQPACAIRMDRVRSAAGFLCHLRHLHSERTASYLGTNNGRVVALSEWRSEERRVGKGGRGGSVRWRSVLCVWRRSSCAG